MEYMKLKSWGQELELGIEVNRYQLNDNLALQLHSIEENFYEPFATLTVNFDNECEKDCAFVDTNDFSDAEKLIAYYQLGKPTGRKMRSGYCEYPEYKFNMEKIKQYQISENELYMPVIECRDMGR